MKLVSTHESDILTDYYYEIAPSAIVLLTVWKEIKDGYANQLLLTQNYLTHEQKSTFLGMYASRAAAENAITAIEGLLTLNTKERN